MGKKEKRRGEVEQKVAKDAKLREEERCLKTRRAREGT
jgi:hypothetical protein